MFYKIRNNNAPSYYLCDCLLPFERNENAYNLRNQTDYSNPFTRLQLQLILSISKLYFLNKLQIYLTFVISKSFTLFLSKIRLSAHSLAIETGRCNKPFTPAEERY
jgi:hypothetical protein